MIFTNMADENEECGVWEMGVWKMRSVENEDFLILLIYVKCHDLKRVSVEKTCTFKKQQLFYCIFHNILSYKI